MKRKIHLVVNFGEDLTLPEWFMGLVKDTGLPLSVAIGKVIEVLDHSGSAIIKDFNDFAKSDIQYVLRDNFFYYKDINDVVKSIVLEELEIEDDVDLEYLGNMLEVGKGKRVPIALGCGYSGFHIPDFLRGSLKDVSINSRVALANLILKLEENADNSNIDLMLEKLKSKEVDCVKYRGRLFYINKDDLLSSVRSLDVDFVDISKKWRIDDYDGSECIEYIVDFTCVDKALNWHN